MSATAKSERLAQTATSRLRSFRDPRPLILLLAVALSGCGDKPPQQGGRRRSARYGRAAGHNAPSTDWDEFTGRFEAVEEVQVRARVGGFVTNVEFKDGDMVRVGDLLYIIDPRLPFEGSRSAQRPTASLQMHAPRRSLPSARLEAEASALVQTSAVSEQVVDIQRRQVLLAGGALLAPRR